MARDSEFAEWLRTQMAAHFITSSYLARSIGSTKQAVNRWRSARAFPDWQNREQVAAFFGVNVAELPGLPPLAPPKPKPITAPGLEGRVFR